MKKLTTNILLQLILTQHSYQRPSRDERIERVFDITKGDRVNIDLAERVGVSHLAVSYPQGINCTLMKTVTEKPFKICRNVSIPVCKTVQKVRLTNITEDCAQQKEYCQYNFRTQEVTQQTIICQKPTEMVCDDSCIENCSMSCERNPIVVCNTVPQTVAITEKKQRCGPDNSLQTTKICFTYPDASWVCKEPRETLDCDREGVRLVAHEVAMPRIECQEKEMEPLCIPENCWLKNNNTDCLTTDIPTEVRLEDQVCEICQEGRTKLRPVLVQEEECDNSSTQEFCSEGIEDSSKWTKRCSVPHILREEVLKKVLENTQDHTNEISDNANDKPNIQESKIIRMKLPVKISRQGNGSLSTIQGADIFFAKQFFQRDLVKQGRNKNEVLIHTNKIENKSKERNHPAISVPFNFVKESDAEKFDMKVNFQFDVPSSTPRPTGVPYVYSDAANIHVTKRPTQSVPANFKTRFAKRPTPQTVTEPSITTNSERATAVVKKPTESPNIDSILDLIISDKDFNIALPLPSQARTTEKYNLLNPKIETLDKQTIGDEKSSSDYSQRFPFLGWQDQSAVFNTNRFQDNNRRINPGISRTKHNFNTFSNPSTFDDKTLFSEEGYNLNTENGNIKNHNQGELRTLPKSEVTGFPRSEVPSSDLSHFSRPHDFATTIRNNAPGSFDTKILGSVEGQINTATNFDGQILSTTQSFKGSLSDQKSNEIVSPEKSIFNEKEVKGINDNKDSSFQVIENFKNQNKPNTDLQVTIKRPSNTNLDRPNNHQIENIDTLSTFPVSSTDSGLFKSAVSESNYPTETRKSQSGLHKASESFEDEPKIKQESISYNPESRFELQNKNSGGENISSKASENSLYKINEAQSYAKEPTINQGRTSYDQESTENLSTNNEQHRNSNNNFNNPKSQDISRAEYKALQTKDDKESYNPENSFEQGKGNFAKENLLNKERNLEVLKFDSQQADSIEGIIERHQDNSPVNQITNNPTANQNIQSEENSSSAPLTDSSFNSAEYENHEEIYDSKIVISIPHDDALEESDSSTTREVSPRKLEVSNSNDVLEPIIQGRIDAGDKNEREQSKIEQPIEKVAVKEGRGMCDHHVSEKERVRCKVIACFRDNNNCFKK